MKPTPVMACLLLLALPLLPGPAAAEASDPQVLVRETVATLRDAVEADLRLVGEDPFAAMDLLEQVLSPHVDLPLISRLILGRRWKAATPAQQDAFIDAMHRMLLRMFALHIKDYHDVSVDYLPTEYRGDNGQRAIVRTRVASPGRPTASVDYRMTRDGATWKVYDVSLFGVSIVRTYHQMVKSVVAKQGIDGLIADMNAMAPLPPRGCADTRWTAAAPAAGCAGQ
ncbi:MAG: ABC transporter substrate-binding protein [Gammaproteobacteria bacterium]|nr:ABC transporter substrate-binding protein [Gammaproteobacteria bacterium]